MTIQQEAIRMISSMPDDTVGVLVEFLKRMMVNNSHSDNCQAERDIQTPPHKRRLGIADGMYIIPDNIDGCNDEIAQMFGVAE